MNEDLMRGLVARLGQLAEVVMVNMVFTPVVVAMALYSVYLVAVVRTPQAYLFAPYVVAGSMALTAKGAVLLHRKWEEYATAEHESEMKDNRSGWHNPSIDVSTQNKLAVGIANGLAVAAIVVPVLAYSYIQIVGMSPTLLVALGRILPSLIMTIGSVWAWIQLSR